MADQDNSNLNYNDFSSNNQFNDIEERDDSANTDNAPPAGYLNQGSDGSNQMQNNPGDMNRTFPLVPGNNQRDQGAPFDPLYTQAAVPREPQVAPVAPMLPQPQVAQPQQAQLPTNVDLSILYTNNGWLDRALIDRMIEATAREPDLLPQWVHVRQRGIEQEHLIINTENLLREVMAQNGGQIPESLLPFFPPPTQAAPTYVPAPIAYEVTDWASMPDLVSPQAVHDYLIINSVRFPGHFQTDWGLEQNGGWVPNTLWQSYMPTSEEVTRWRIMLTTGLQCLKTHGVMMIIVTLTFITVTASTRLEIYGSSIDEQLGRYDTREAFHYVLNLVLQYCGEDQQIRDLVGRVATLLRNATESNDPNLGRAVDPCRGAELVAAERARRESQVAASNTAGSSTTRPPVPLFSAAGSSPTTLTMAGNPFSPGASRYSTGRATPQPAVNVANSAQEVIHRGRGRPFGSRNKPKVGTTASSSSAPTTSTPNSPRSRLRVANETASGNQGLQQAPASPKFGMAGGRRRRRSVVNNAVTTSKQEGQVVGETGSQCEECHAVAPQRHTSMCSQYLELCKHCGNPVTRHVANCLLR